MTTPDTIWVSRWIVALSDPLVDTASRIEIDEQLLRLVAVNPHWFSAWVSGFVSDLVRSLDPKDPWRNLVVQDGQTLLADGSPFGTWVDATDVIPAGDPDLRSDLGLAALASKLDPEAAQLLSVSSQGWENALAWCEKNLVTAASLDVESARGVFEIASQAIRWALHRRRVFCGIDDPFATLTAVAWINRAGKLTSGESWDEARAARSLRNNSITPGIYEQTTAPPGTH